MPRSWLSNGTILWERNNAEGSFYVTRGDIDDLRSSVRQADLDAWVGQPVVALEVHPIFLTVPVVKTQASDGTEIWNYVNGSNWDSAQVAVAFTVGQWIMQHIVNFQAAFSDSQHATTSFSSATEG